MALPEGASVDLDAATGAVVVTDSEGGVIGAFGSPWAVGASGADIETSFTVEGDELVQLVQLVQHAGAQYPRDRRSGLVRSSCGGWGASCHPDCRTCSFVGCCEAGGKANRQQ